MKFFYVKDKALLTTKLDNIFIGSRKLYVNIPRFQRMHHLRKRLNPTHLINLNMERGKNLEKVNESYPKGTHNLNKGSSYMEVVISR